jgi:hypothetical protein
MRKNCYELYHSKWSWVKLLSNYWKKVKQLRYHQENQDHVFLRFSPALCSRYLSSKIPIQGVEERRILNTIRWIFQFLKKKSKAATSSRQRVLAGQSPISLNNVRSGADPWNLNPRPLPPSSLFLSHNQRPPLPKPHLRRPDLPRASKAAPQGHPSPWELLPSSSPQVFRSPQPQGEKSIFDPISQCTSF